MISSMGSVFTSLVSMSISGYAISEGSVMRELDATKMLTVLGLTTFTITFGGRIFLSSLKWTRWLILMYLSTDCTTSASSTL